MAEVITMPRLSDTMEEGTIVEWFKQIGDEINQGDILAEVETDKANMELESFYEGKLLYVGVEQGDVVPVDKVIAVVGEEGEDYQEALNSATANENTSEPAQQEPKSGVSVDTTASSESKNASEKEKPAEAQPQAKADTTRIKASPLAKKLAAEKGIELQNLKGTGDNGRIIKRDIEEAEKQGITHREPQPSEPAQPATAPQTQAPEVPEPPQNGQAGASYEDVPLSQMRKTIAKRLAESKFTAPHFYLTMDINMDQAIIARKRINEISDVKTSFNDLITKAASVALKRNPKANASWLGDSIRYYHHVNTGVAIAVEEGLVVPVIYDADQKGVSDIAKETQDYAEKAHNKQLQPQDFEGNTFTVSNLGMYGIDNFTAIINPPDSCILAVGAIKQQPNLVEGEWQATNMMRVTLSCDHRVVDGAIGAQFLKTFRENLEDPFRMLV